MDQKEEDRNISAKLRELRRIRGLSVDSLAKKMGENSQKVGRIERGARSITLDYLVKVSKALEAPLESFLVENEENESAACHSDLLSRIVVLVEEHCLNFPMKSSKKALMISKIYELTLRFPEENQKMFMDSMFELMNCLEA